MTYNSLKDKFDSDKKETLINNTIDTESNNLYVGQKLFCANGEEVIVFEVNEHEIIVEYNNKKYSRHKNIIGEKLFFKSPIKIPCMNNKSNTNSSIVSEQKVDTINESMINLKFFFESDIVKHNFFGIGTVIMNDGKIIRVSFNNGDIIDFSYETCLENRILIILADDKISKYPLTQLKKISDDLFNINKYNLFSLNVNFQIIEKDPRNLKYLYRLATCYKNQNLFEESISVYKKILKIDKNSIIAKDNLEIYGKEIFYKPKDKIFDGIWRDVHHPRTIDEEDLKKLTKIFK